MSQIQYPRNFNLDSWALRQTKSSTKFKKREQLYFTYKKEVLIMTQHDAMSSIMTP
jgi:hypothetical protein